MDLGKELKLGTPIEEIKEGDSLSITQAIEDQDLLLYLGLTNDANPLYLQHDFAAQTEYEKPIVPSILLMGIISSAISKHLPGPGAHIVNFSINFMMPVFHYEVLTFFLEVIKVDQMKDVVTLSVEGTNAADERVLDAVVMVQPPKLIEKDLVIEE